MPVMDPDRKDSPSRMDLPGCSHQGSRNCGIASIVLLLILPVTGAQCHKQSTGLKLARAENAERDATLVSLNSASIGSHISAPDFRPSTIDLESLASRDPIAFARLCLDRYESSGVKDYTCLFRKQENIGDKLRDPEIVEVQFREEPFSVDMKWIHNAHSAERALYVQGAWPDSRGREQAWVRPSGSVIKLFVPKLRQPIDGYHAQKASRRTLDQFGFHSTLNLIVQYIDLAIAAGHLDIKFAGQDVVDGRPTWVFERRFLSQRQGEPYPDKLLVYHIDQQWLVPVACYAYDDLEGDELLGSYVLTDVRFNVGLDDDDFDPKLNGF